MATKGSCMCGEIKFDSTSEPLSTALCHCTDCQKWSGSAFTSNAIVPRDSFTVTHGTPKSYDVTGDSGKINKHHFCANCGSSLYTELEILPGVTIIKAGTLDGGAANLAGKPSVEFYCKSRVQYLTGLDGVVQESMLG
ncbi:Glutathione-dependent formaldehyde-activating enzyme [Geosmithia morbida]|uniref:Glutathione-dependent formaldehyde-activating enzyme n=1 Tax=Geosmithia morbida TaxID=1094350 RepID=A0A9P4YWC3_9HYPO|nr:Glutathione-dependent formaldehyde-activating enzyme [Geosmithia morbida]KAF4122921.1 Glutathione-dependent formaldehyde-activating enzyme [Geosmithia morbida]